MPDVSIVRLKSISAFDAVKCFHATNLNIFDVRAVHGATKLDKANFM